MSDSTPPSIRPEDRATSAKSGNTIVISTGSRLHFGLLDTADPFGGVGVMIQRPGTVVTVTRSEAFTCDQAVSSRVRPIVERVAQMAGLPNLPACHVQVPYRPPAHCGLGSGTQLSLAAAEAVCRFAGVDVEPLQLAAEVAVRGKRSAVGVHGYFSGGLIFEAGDGTCPVNPLQRRIELPADWHVAVVQPAGLSTQVSGADEADQFARLEPADHATSRTLRQIVTDQIVPASRDGNFTAFAKSVESYNAQSGMLFSAVQGGPYNGTDVTRVIDQLRDLGARGVGQSSWGPGVFAWFESGDQAETFCGQLSPDISLITITRVLNQSRALGVRSENSRASS